MNGYTTLYVVELCCLACGRDSGVLESRVWPWAGPVLLRPSDGQVAMTVCDWSRLRCAVCNGNVYAYADEVRIRRVYHALSPDELDLPRRGRPPKWLVARRRASLQHSDDWRRSRAGANRENTLPHAHVSAHGMCRMHPVHPPRDQIHRGHVSGSHAGGHHAGVREDLRSMPEARG